MSIRESDRKSPLHWRHFIALEEDLASLARYVEFASENFATYSVELTSILLAACSEVDVVAKQLCLTINKKSKAKNIAHYAAQIASAYPTIAKFEVEIPKYGLQLKPWTNWGGRTRKSPYWWQAHNDVKHNRTAHFKDANLDNALNAMGGLYVLTLYLYKQAAEWGELAPNPILYRPGEPHYSGVTQMDTEMLLTYHLGS